MQIVAVTENKLFGYVRPMQGELKVKEFEAYKALYCGLCSSMGNHISILSRFTLNYDIVFLAAVRYILTQTNPESEPFRCTFKFWKKKIRIAGSDVLKYCSAIAALLVYYKCIDDVNDTHNIFNKTIKRIVLLFFTPAKKKACRLYPDLSSVISEPLEALAADEKTGTVSPDAAAEHFARLMSGVTSYGLSGSEKRIGEQIGLSLGRWLYLIDAVEDAPDDLKEHSFNPFLNVFKDDLHLFAENLDIVKHSLTASLETLDNALSVAPKHFFTPIAENIVQLGLVSAQETICSGFSKRLSGGKQKK